MVKPTCSTHIISGLQYTSCSRYKTNRNTICFIIHILIFVRPFYFTFLDVFGYLLKEVSWVSWSLDIKVSFSPIKSVQINFSSPIVCLTKLFVERVVEGHQEKLVKLLDLYVEHVHNKFNKYAFCFFFCELLNICISISQVTFLTNFFLTPSYKMNNLWLSIVIWSSKKVMQMSRINVEKTKTYNGVRVVFSQSQCKLLFLQWSDWPIGVTWHKHLPIEYRTKHAIPDQIIFIKLRPFLSDPDL